MLSTIGTSNNLFKNLLKFYTKCGYDVVNRKGGCFSRGLRTMLRRSCLVWLLLGMGSYTSESECSAMDYRDGGGRSCVPAGDQTPVTFANVGESTANGLPINPISNLLNSQSPGFGGGDQSNGIDPTFSERSSADKLDDKTGLPDAIPLGNASSTRMLRTRADVDLGNVEEETKRIVERLDVLGSCPSKVDWVVCEDCADVRQKITTGLNIIIGTTNKGSTPGENNNSSLENHMRMILAHPKYYGAWSGIILGEGSWHECRETCVWLCSVQDLETALDLACDLKQHSVIVTEGEKAHEYELFYDEVEDNCRGKRVAVKVATFNTTYVDEYELPGFDRTKVRAKDQSDIFIYFLNTPSCPRSSDEGGLSSHRDGQQLHPVALNFEEILGYLPFLLAQQVRWQSYVTYLMATQWLANACNNALLPGSRRVAFGPVEGQQSRIVIPSRPASR